MASNHRCMLSFQLLSLVLSAWAYPHELSVPGQYATIQLAINAAADGDVVIVSPGRYDEVIDFRGKAIIVRGTKPEVDSVVLSTVIRGARFVSGEAPNSVLTGFWITGARGQACIFCRGSSPVILKNVIGPEVQGPDSSLGIVGEGSSALLIDNVVSGNNSRYAGAAVLLEGGSPVLVGNVIVQNRGWDAGGILLMGTNAAVCQNTIAENGGVVGGIESFVGSDVMCGNVIGGNTSSGYGAVTLESSSLLCSNTITENKPGYAISSPVLGSSSVVGNLIVNNDCHMGVVSGYRMVFSNNVIAGHRGYAMLCSGVVFVKNCIIGTNHSANRLQILVPDWASDEEALVVENSVVAGGRGSVVVEGAAMLAWGPGNIDADPLFVDPGHWDDAGTPDDRSDDTFIPGDYHLLPGSPCIDAGRNDVDNPDTPEIETLPATDISGLPRVIDGDLDGTATVDIGAYEYLPGDVNYDGKVNVLDLLLVRNSLGRDPASSIEARKADVNADGAVNVEDLITVRGRLGR